MKAIYYNIFGLGHINPTLPLVKALVQSGVEVIYHTSPERKDVVELAGASFRNYGRDDYKAADYNPGKIFVLQTLPATLGLLPFLREEIERERPDFILYDSMAPWGKLLAHIYGIPSFCTVTTFALNEKLREQTFAAHQVVADDLNRTIIEQIQAQFGLELPLVNTLGAYNDCNFVFTAKDFNPPLLELPPQHFHFVGALKRELTGCAFPFDLLTKKPRKVITMALGTILPSEDPSVFSWYQTMLEAFMGDERFWVVLAVGNKENLQRLGKLSPNVIAQMVIPQAEVLAETSVFVSHAGMNSVNEALTQGVPMVLIPHSKDQFVNAERVVEMGAGLLIKKNELKASTLKKAVLDVLFSPKIQSNCERLQQSFSQTLGLSGMLQKIQEKVNHVAQ